MKNGRIEGMRAEAREAILNYLKEGYSGYYCDFHNEVFNMDHYNDSEEESRKILEEIDPYRAIGMVTKYEQDNFGESTYWQKYSDPVWVLSMVWYIIGGEELFNVFKDCDLWDDLWNEKATEETNQKLVAWLEENNRA